MAAAEGYVLFTYESGGGQRADFPERPPHAFEVEEDTPRSSRPSLACSPKALEVYGWFLYVSVCIVAGLQVNSLLNDFDIVERDFNELIQTFGAIDASLNTTRSLAASTNLESLPSRAAAVSNAFDEVSAATKVFSTFKNASTQPTVYASMFDVRCVSGSFVFRMPLTVDVVSVVAFNMSLSWSVNSGQWNHVISASAKWCDEQPVQLFSLKTPTGRTDVLRYSDELIGGGGAGFSLNGFRWRFGTRSTACSSGFSISINAYDARSNFSHIPCGSVDYHVTRLAAQATKE